MHCLTRHDHTATEATAASPAKVKEEAGDKKPKQGQSGEEADADKKEQAAKEDDLGFDRPGGRT